VKSVVIFSVLRDQNTRRHNLRENLWTENDETFICAHTQKKHLTKVQGFDLDFSFCPHKRCNTLLQIKFDTSESSENMMNNTKIKKTSGWNSSRIILVWKIRRNFCGFRKHKDIYIILFIVLWSDGQKRFLFLITPQNPTIPLLSLCAASRMWVRHRSVVIVPPEGGLEFSAGLTEKIVFYSCHG